MTGDRTGRPSAGADRTLSPDLGPVVGDALGEGLRAAWNSGTPNSSILEILEFSSGLISTAPMVRYFDGPASWADLDKWLLGHCRGTVLDLGTGAGRFALEVATDPNVKRVCAFDSSAGAVEVARARGLSDVAVADWRDFRSTQGFDTLTLFGNNLGLLAQVDDPRQGLEKLTALARPGGRIVGTGGLPEALPPGARSQERVHGCQVFTARTRHAEIASDWFDYGFMDPDVFAGWAVQSGWRVVDRAEEGTQWGVVLTR